ncbi:MAG: aldose 1-epimerase family protein [Treponema sp.]|nr:aldose 1-epimerase family protein [Treponema sp.]
MEDYKITNGIISIGVRGKGAELSSLKKGNSEYLWNADPSIWNRSAPQLFPIVGTLAGNEYRYGGRTYYMSRHGFARDCIFSVSKQTDKSICLTLHDTPETIKMYPFPFIFDVEYILTGSTLTYTWRIMNTGKNVMYFSVGGHPAFKCPPSDGKFADCSLKFGGKIAVADINCETLNAAGLLQAQMFHYKLDNGIVKITDDMFSHDALILEDSGIHAVSLLDSGQKEYIRVDFDADIFGLWSPQDKHAPFLCIEPWYGRCDRAGYNGELQDREWGNELESGKTFERSFSVTVM